MQTAPISPAALADIYEMWHIPFWQTGWFILTCISIGAIIAIGAVATTIFLLRKRRQSYIQTPWERALGRLQKLANPTEAESNASLLYTRLTLLLKQYLQERYDRTLEGHTDTELAARMHELPDEAAAQLRQIFEGAVFIKFARAKARQERIKRDLRAAQAVISLTTPPSAPQKN